MITFPYVTTALRIDQRLGTFFVANLPADLLLRVAISDTMRATLNDDGVGYTLKGTQRVVQDKRLTEIANYINRVDASFPNSIIVAANYDMKTGFDQGELEDVEEEGRIGIVNSPSKSWTVTPVGETYRLEIPTDAQLAAVIDGQHRLFSFAKATPDARTSMNLLCSIFLDLPKPLQAQVFATINSTQKRVDRSLTFELFGYNVSDEPEEFWTPDKLAVFFARKLGTDEGSYLCGRIVVAPKRDRALQRIASQADWRVSTAVIVDGILRLFSSNPKRDTNLMKKKNSQTRFVLRNGPKDRSPLRRVFVDGNDALIYKMVYNFITACSYVFWQTAPENSFIFRTVGVQALFDILRKIAMRSYNDRDISVSYFQKILEPAGSIDFTSDEYRVPAGSGRTVIRRALEERIEIDL